MLTTLLIFPCAFALIFWLAVWWRMSRILGNRPTIREGLRISPDQPEIPDTISVIIPAHNEQRVIDACAHAVRNQDYPSLEIIFVLDRCTDNTAALLAPHAKADPRLTIIENHHCPDGWAGKCHAASIGAARATGDYLLFSDADTQFDPSLIRAALTLARTRNLGLLSLLPTLTHTHPFEKTAQPVAAMTLGQMYPINLVNKPSSSGGRPFANGQFLLFSRSCYETIGGHAAVKDDLLEDIAFARAADYAQQSLGLYFADGLLTVSMYDSLESFSGGWKRIFIESCNRKPRRLRKHAWRLLTLGLLIPLFQIAALALGIARIIEGEIPSGSILIALIALGWIVQALTLSIIYPLGGAPRSALFRYPLGCLLVARILLKASRDLLNRTPVKWGGKEYILEPRP